MTIRSLIFDFGNVVGFFDHHIATRRLARRSPLPEEAIYRFVHNGPLEDDFEAGRIGPTEFLRAMRDGCRLDGTDDELAEEFADIFTPNEPVCSLIPHLKPAYRLILGSNCTPLHAGRFRDQFADTLRHFDGMVLSYEIGVRKPKPGFYDACIRLAGCAPQECVFIDDLPANVSGAEACGLHGIVYHSPEELIRCMQSLGVVPSAFSAFSAVDPSSPPRTRRTQRKTGGKQ
jgi:putative hydrolase of the HAD superfamily